MAPLQVSHPIAGLGVPKQSGLVIQNARITRTPELIGLHVQYHPERQFQRVGQSAQGDDLIQIDRVRRHFSESREIRKQLRPPRTVIWPYINLNTIQINPGGVDQQAFGETHLAGLRAWTGS